MGFFRRDESRRQIFMNNTKACRNNGQNDLSCFFEPKNIAIIGSFKENYFGGYVVIKSLLKAGYSGQIFPVNPGYKEVHGIKVYPSITEVQEEIDLALIMINSHAVPQVFTQCAEKGVKGVIVIADGFAERDEEGANLQDEIVGIARAHGVRVIGPNTAGIVNTSSGLNPCPYDAGYYKLRKGSVAICSQTGMINPQAFPYPDLAFGVSKICDLGNKCDLNECDVLEYLEKDEQTKVISMYLESIPEGQRFLEVSKRVTAKKPVLVVKSGRTGEGAKASVSHTGSMAVDDQIFEAACTQGGLLRLETFSELFELPKVFASQPLPRGNRMGIATVTGGIAVMAIDKGAAYGLTIARLSPETAEMLEKIFPGLGEMPVDIGPMMATVKNAFALYPKILNAIMADDNVDALFNVLWANPAGNIIEYYIEAYEAIKDRYQKPVVTWVYGPNSAARDDLAAHLENMGFPVFKEPETSIKALGLALRYAWIKAGKIKS
jgi:acyl-CoA synthetase (NDP forming)